jgi:ABC-type protease/lipase transport system fused ATPase/permease subunit
MIDGTKILILDEPSSGMDSEALRAVWDILQDIRKDYSIENSLYRRDGCIDSNVRFILIDRFLIYCFVQLIF